jgi:Cobalamin biosynthesis protein CobN and related Mg-chelatases
VNVPDTIVGILNRLKLDGYTVEDIPQNGDALVSLMIERGINVANWAPGVLEELANNPNTILWDADEYIAWFNTLHPLAQKQVTEGPVGYIEEVTKLGVSYGANSDVVKA